jgi:hypothetical protein
MFSGILLTICTARIAPIIISGFGGSRRLLIPGEPQNPVTTLQTRIEIINIPTTDIWKGVTPFIVAEVFFLALIAAVPSISMWLPGLMISK